MKNLTPSSYEKIALLLFACLMVSACAFLFFIERTQNSYLTDKDWWAISFADPLSTEDYNFTIENYTKDHTSFTYTVRDRRYPDQVQFPTKKISVPRGEKITIPFPIFVSHAELAVAPAGDLSGEKILWK